MKRKFCLYILFFLSGVALGQRKDSLSVELALEEDSIEIIAQLSFTFALENQSNFALDVIPKAFTYGTIRRIGQVYLEVKEMSDTVWVKTNCIIGYEMVGRDYLTLAKCTLAPEEISWSEKITCSTLDIFQNEGHYQLRIRYITPYKQTYFSKPQAIYVKPFLNQDQIAFEYLMKLEKPDFILFPEYYSNNKDTSELKDAKYIADLYPKTFLGTNASFYLCFTYATMAEKISFDLGDKSAGLYYLRQSKKYGLSVVEYGTPFLQENASKTLNQLEDILVKLFGFDLTSQLSLEFWYPPFKKQ